MNKDELTTTLVVVILTFMIVVMLGNIISRNSFDAGYQACIEEYNLYGY